jgi:hypothetical protein
MRLVFRGAEETAEDHPGTALIFKGVDSALFQTGFQDRPFRLVGIERAYLAPGSEEGIVSREDLGGVSKFRLSDDDCLRLLEGNQARVLEVTAGDPRDITLSFEAALRAEIAASHRVVDVGDPLYSSRLGTGWYPAENGFRWMARSATLQLAGPTSASERLYVTGFGAAAALASGAVKLRFRADGLDVGSSNISQPNRIFAFDFPLPADLRNRSTMEVSIEADNTFRPPGDSRDLGMIFGTFAIR